MPEYVIVTKAVSKDYKLYGKPKDRLLDILPFYRNKFNLHRALSDITINVRKGESLGIIGKNGSGKSTLLKIITGITTPTSGTLEVHGEVSALLELGTGFNPEYSGVENIYLNGIIRGVSRHRMMENVERIIDFADIGNYIDQPVKTYSSGMFARLAFAVMISFKPDILIVDEALSVGDNYFQHKCNTYMKNEMKNTTKIFVSHDMNSITSMCNRVILLDQGKIIEDGLPLNVVKEYLRRMHTEMFFRGNKATDDAEKVDNNGNKEGWINVKASDVGGAGDITIEQARCFVNENISDIVKPGDQVELQYLLSTLKIIPETIFGYAFKDKYGNTIFAQNTLGAKISAMSIDEGRYILYLRFEWPEVKEGDYFLTIGIGEGTHEMIHTIQCWAHNVLHLTALALKPMHGIINHTIDNIRLIKQEKMQ